MVDVPTEADPLLRMNAGSSLRVRLSVAKLLAVLSAFLVLSSVVPGLTGHPFVAQYGWRFAVVLLVMAVWLDRGRPVFAAGVVLPFLPWMLAIATAVVVDANATLFLLRHVLLVVAAGIIATDRTGQVVPVFLNALLAGLFGLCLLEATPLLSQGWSWEIARHAKEVAALTGGLPFNTALFLLSVCLVAAAPRARLWRYTAYGLFAFLCILLASRTALVAFLLAIPAVVLASRLRLTAALAARPAWGLLAAAVLIGMPLAAMLYAGFHPTPEQARLTAGRLYLWQAALQQSSVSPVFGSFDWSYAWTLNRSYGALPLEQAWEFAALFDARAGGFHSVWLQNLVQFGVVGVSGLFLSYVLMLWVSLRQTTSLAAQALVLLLLARSFVEYSALFAFANAPLEFVSICTWAFLIRPRTEGTAGSRVKLQ